jgi:hypothetical protein
LVLFGSVLSLVSVGVVLASSLDLVLVVSGVFVNQESLLNIWVFDLEFSGKDWLFDQKFFITDIDLLQTNGFFNSPDCSLNFIIKSFLWIVGNDSQVRMTSPGLKSLLVEMSGNLNTFRSSNVVIKSVVIFSPTGGRAEKDDTVVSSISQSDPAPSFFVHDGLEFFLWDVCVRIDDTSVAEDNGGGFGHFSQSGEIVFGIHLEPHQQGLEVDSFLGVEFGHEDHAAGYDNHGGDFGDGKYSVSLFGHFLSDSLEWGGLAGTGPTGDDDFVDGELGVVPDFVGADLLLEVDLVHLGDEFDGALGGWRGFGDFLVEEDLPNFLFLSGLVDQVADDWEERGGAEDLALVAGNFINNVAHFISVSN